MVVLVGAARAIFVVRDVIGVVARRSRLIVVGGIGIGNRVDVVAVIARDLGNVDEIASACLLYTSDAADDS